MTEDRRADEGDVLWDGFIAGALGALAVATWFLATDFARGAPLHTPALLGTALLEGPGAAGHMEAIHTDVVAIYSGVHMGAFAAFGIAVAWLIDQLRRRPVLGYLLVFLFVAFEFGFYVFILAFARPLVEGLPAWEILVGNLLAAAVMAGYFAIRNPGLLPVDFSADRGDARSA